MSSAHMMMDGDSSSDSLAAVLVMESVHASVWGLGPLRKPPLAVPG